MDASYYAWGPALFNPTQATQAHGYINGSGQPMRFVTETGQVIPVYQQVTALVDEQLVTGSYAEGLTVAQAQAVSRQLIDESQAGSYAAVMAQFHIDYYLFSEVGPWVDGTMAYAQSLQIPMWTTQRWLQFVEAKAATTITNVNWSANDKTLTFTATLPAGAEAHTLLVPATFGSDTVTAVAVNGSPVTAPSLVVNGRTMRAITLTAGAARNVAVLYGVPTPAIAIGDVTIIEGHTGTTVANLPLTLSSPSSNSVTVNYQTVNGTATQPGDYQSGSGTITFAPFATSRVVPVTIVGDLTLEPNETFSVTLSAPTNATIDDGTGIVTISDDDAPPTITITDATVTEGNSGTTPATFTVTLSHASGNPVTVQYATANGTATAGADYTAGSGTLTFNPGVTSLPIAVPVVGETAAEPNETFAVNLTAPVNGVFGDNQGAGTIINDDSGTVVTTATFPVLAGGDDVNEEGTTFTANASTVWVGSGETALTSYAGFRFTGVTIPPGAVISSARLELRSSSSQWLTTAFEFGIEAAVNSAPFSTASRPSQRTLLAPRVQHSSNVQWLADTWYQLDQLASLLQPVVNQAGWASGNAVALVVRGAGQNWARKFATAFEGGAAFAPRLVVTYSFVEGSQPSLSINDVTVTEGNSGTASATFNVSLSAPAAQVVTATWTAANGTATAGSDYTAARAPSPSRPTHAPQTVTVPVIGDTTVEPNETFVVNLTGPTNATIADGSGVRHHHQRRRAPPRPRHRRRVACRGQRPGRPQLAFTVTLSPASSQQVTVNYATADGTAHGRRDYTAASGHADASPAGETSQTVIVTVNGDTAVEANETFSVTPDGADQRDHRRRPRRRARSPTTTACPTLAHQRRDRDRGQLRHHRPPPSPVTLSPASGLTVTVNYATANGTATAPERLHRDQRHADLRRRARPPSRPSPCRSSATRSTKPDETFIVNLSGPTNATHRRRRRRRAPSPTTTARRRSRISDVTRRPKATPARRRSTFTVTLSAASGQTVTVNYATANGTAAPGRTTPPAIGHAHLRARRDHQDRHRAGHRRPARRGQRDLHRHPERRRPTPRIADAGRHRHDHRRRPDAHAVDQRRGGDRGQRGHHAGRLHGHALGRQRPDRDRDLRHDQRHGARPGRTSPPSPATLTFAPGDTTQTVDRRPSSATPSRGRRDLHRRAVGSGQRDHRRRHRPGDHHQRRRRADPRDRRRHRGRRHAGSATFTVTLSDAGRPGGDRELRDGRRSPPPPAATSRRRRGTLTFAGRHD